jgi:hypothetical protein
LNVKNLKAWNFIWEWAGSLSSVIGPTKKLRPKGHIGGKSNMSTRSAATKCRTSPPGVMGMAHFLFFFLFSFSIFSFFYFFFVLVSIFFFRLKKCYNLLVFKFLNIQFSKYSKLKICETQKLLKFEYFLNVQFEKIIFKSV